MATLSSKLVVVSELREPPSLRPNQRARKAMVATTVGQRIGRASRNEYEVTLSVDGAGRCTSNSGDSAIDAMLHAVATRSLVDVEVFRMPSVQSMANAGTELTSANVGAALGGALLAAAGHTGPAGARGLRGGGSAAAVHNGAFVIVGFDMACRAQLIVHDARVVDASNVITTPTFFFIDAFVREAQLGVHVLIVSGTTEDVTKATIKGFAMAMHDAVREDL